MKRGAYSAPLTRSETHPWELRIGVRDLSVSEREVLVDGTHRGRSFAVGCCDSLGRACPDVACGEQPGMAGLKGQRSPGPECLENVKLGVSECGRYGGVVSRLVWMVAHCFNLLVCPLFHE